MSTTNSKWLPPQQEGFGPWIEFTGEPGACPGAADTEVEYLSQGEQRDQKFWSGPDRASTWSWRRCAAYCVKLEEPQVQQPAASGLTRLVPLREKALHTLEETTISDLQVTCWGVSLDGVPMIRLDTLAGAQQVQRLADAAFQAGRQKAFSDLLGFVEGQR